MKAFLGFLTTVLIASESQAQAVYENNLFAEQQQQKVLSFESEQQLSEYLENNKASTYRYFQRLTTSNKKQVFELHKANPDSDITDIVVKIYRTNNRS